MTNGPGMIKTGREADQGRFRAAIIPPNHCFLFVALLLESDVLQLDPGHLHFLGEVLRIRVLIRVRLFDALSHLQS